MNSQQPDHPWRSKDELKQHLTRLVRELGAATYPVPQSDCIEIVRDDTRILVAIKESRQEKMWVDARLFSDLYSNRSYKKGFILLIDHRSQRLLVLPSTVIIVSIVVRAKRGRAFHESVHVERVSSGSGYEVRVLRETNGVPVPDINTLEPVLSALHPDSAGEGS